MAGYKLGLDIGAKSVGWALIEDGKRPSIVDIGVRVFPEGVDRDTKGLEQSKNATRREARGARRMRQRRTRRREKLVELLQSSGLLPKDKDELDELLKKEEPYALRAQGLDEKLELVDFGRALYHLNQRRGFKSNRKGGDAKEDGKVKKEAGELGRKIEEAGCRTLGEYFSKLDPEEERLRGRYTFRSMYKDEFDLLWEKQAEYYPDVLTEELGKKVGEETILFQRPLKPTDDLIGDCELEDGEKRCARGDWYARRFRILQDVNNLKIHNGDGSVVELRQGQRELILEEMSNAKEVRFSKLRKALGLLESQEFNAEYETNEKGKKREKIKGDEFNSVMGKKVFGAKVWVGMEEAEKVRLNELVVDLDDDELIEKLSNEYGLDEKQIEAVLKISLPGRYMSFSRKAIQKLLPLMEEGKRTDEALAEIYPDRNKREDEGQKERLGFPEDLRNPIVNRGLFEVRKVVNAIIREYGKPEGVAIEMAREVKGSARERKEQHFKMLDNEKRNEEVRETLMRDMNILNPSRNDVIKYKLWEECGKVCPYTGKSISQNALFGPNPEFQIEHILPYNRSLDDSYMNKTLCEVHENISVKGNKTPYEAYSGDEEKYEAIKQRIKVLPWPKRRKFLQEQIDLDECIKRELNDTRYICREVVKYVRDVCKKVSGTRGRITSELRHQWGLNNILDLSGSGLKNRDDHRHHAIDAAVVAVTRNKHLRDLAGSKYSVGESSFEQPWEDFREELAEKVKHINVSHRVTRKVSGQLHEETSYGVTKEEDVYVYRKKLEDLTGPMVGKIVDPVVKNIVKERLEGKGIDPEAVKKIPKEVWSEPLYMRNTKSDKRVKIKKVRIRDIFKNMVKLKNRNGEEYRAVAPGSNHHIEIFEYEDEKGNLRRDGVVVSMFDAVGRKRRCEPVVNCDHGENRRFVCSLCINELVMMKDKSGEMDLFRVQKMSQNKQIYFRHHTAASIDNEVTLLRKQVSQFDGYKVTVDPLGRVHKAND